MGWKIGDQNVGQVTTEFEGGISSTNAYLGLKDIYSIYKSRAEGSPEQIIYKAEILIGIWASKDAKTDGEPSLKAKGLSDSVFVDITETEFMTALGAESIFSFLSGKLVPAVELIKPDWTGKLVADF